MNIIDIIDDIFGIEAVDYLHVMEFEDYIVVRVVFR